MQESRSNHRKKKHKHKNIEKVGDEGSDLNPPSSKVKVPADAYTFMKDSSMASPAIHGYPVTPKVAGHGYPSASEFTSTDLSAF